MATLENSIKVCSVEGCGGQHEAKGYCSKHYLRLKRHGSINLPPPDPVTTTCDVDGCNNIVKRKKLCKLHYKRVWKHGDVGGPLPIKRAKGTGSYNHSGYLITISKGKRCMEHIKIAETALGKQMAKGNIVHHVDGNPKNNNKSNLVICENQAYHLLIHQRTRALEECGNASWRKCNFCKQYDDPRNLVIADNPGSSCYHKECKSIYNRMHNKVRCSRRKLK